MMDRQRTIADSFERFGKARKLPGDQLVSEVVNLVLEAKGMPALTPDERRYLSACVSCGWWEPYAHQRQPAGCGDEFDRIPTPAERIRAAADRTSAPAGAAPGRRTLWD